MLYGLRFESHRRYNFLAFWITCAIYRRKKVHVRYLSSADERLLSWANKKSLRLPIAIANSAPSKWESPRSRSHRPLQHQSASWEVTVGPAKKHSKPQSQTTMYWWNKMNIMCNSGINAENICRCYIFTVSNWGCFLADRAPQLADWFYQFYFHFYPFPLVRLWSWTFAYDLDLWT